MVILFERQADFSIMEDMLKAYEEKRDREMRVDGEVANNIIEAIRREIKIQKYTRAGYSSKHIRCHRCRNVWLALYDHKHNSVECPKCKTKIHIKVGKEN